MRLQRHESQPVPKRNLNIFKATFYRNWHAYLSAFAFVALMFFSATGILLNHPEWFENGGQSERSMVTLSAAQISDARAADDLPRALLAAIGGQTTVYGAYSDAYVDGDTVTLRLQGVRGSSDIYVDLVSGVAEVSVQRSSVVTILNELHRGVMSGPVWKGFIDVIAGLVLVLSLIGYLLFFSLRFRLRTSLILTGLSVGVMVMLFVAFVP